MNYNLITLFGLQRSGNHAIINWILGLEDGMLFYNNVNPRQNLNESFWPISIPENSLSLRTRENKKIITHEKEINRLIRNNNINTILCSYENTNIINYNESFFIKNIISEYGEPHDHKKIIIIRNPLNMLASTIKILEQWKNNNNISNHEYTRKLNLRMQSWNNYANLFINDEKKFIKIKFEDFVSSKDYRTKKAIELGYSNNDKNITFISDAGNGSSFGSVNGLNNRWLESENKNLLIQIINNNPNTIALIKELYPDFDIPKL